MPALTRPRHEAFAQAIFAGLFRKPGEAYKPHHQCYTDAGYTAKYLAAEANASRLLRNAKVLARVQELQQEAIQHVKESVDKLVSELNEDRRDAKADGQHSAAISAVLGKAKLLGLITDKHADVTKTDFSQAKSMHDIGIGLLAQVGLDSPSDADIAAAIEANDVLVATLEAIRDRAQGIVSQ